MTNLSITPPLSLKEQALEAIEKFQNRIRHVHYAGEGIETIWTALEALDIALEQLNDNCLRAAYMGEAIETVRTALEALPPTAEESSVVNGMFA